MPLLFFVFLLFFNDSRNESALGEDTNWLQLGALQKSIQGLEELNQDSLREGER